MKKHHQKSCSRPGHRGRSDGLQAAHAADRRREGGHRDRDQGRRGQVRRRRAQGRQRLLQPRPSTKSPPRTRSSSRSSVRPRKCWPSVLKQAEDLKAALPAKIEAAKNLAIQLQGEAKAAIDEAKALLEKAPKGKGTEKDIEALKADLAGAETLFADIQTALDAQDYIAAQDKAKSIKTTVATVVEQVKAAIEKVTGKK